MTDNDTTVTQALIGWVLFGVKVFSSLVVAGVALMYVNQDKLLYFPSPPNFPQTPAENPKGFQLPSDWTTSGQSASNKERQVEKIPFEETFVKTIDGASLHVWLMLQPNSDDAVTLIYFHGNAGNMGFRLKNAAEMYAKVKVNVLMMDYRGYGSSTGVPTEKGINLDADAVLKYAVEHPKLKRSQIVVFGRSLGGAVCFSLASRNPKLVTGIVVENTFTSVSSMVDVLMPFLAPLKAYVLRINWDSADLLEKGTINQPILFIAGKRDELVPPVQMKTLHKLAEQRQAVSTTDKKPWSDFFEVESGSHNDTWERAGNYYYIRLKRFIDKLVNGEESTDKCASSEGDDDFCFVKKEDTESDTEGEKANVALPTMGTNFQVK